MPVLTQARSQGVLQHGSQPVCIASPAECLPSTCPQGPAVLAAGVEKPSPPIQVPVHQGEPSPQGIFPGPGPQPGAAPESQGEFPTSCSAAATGGRWKEPPGPSACSCRPWMRGPVPGQGGCIPPSAPCLSETQAAGQGAWLG